MRGNEWKLVVAFIVGAVLSFAVGMYVLGPLFVARQADRTEVTSETSETETAPPTLAESIPNGVYRRDVDSVPDHTAVILERVQRPWGSEPEPFTSPPSPTPSPPQPRQPSEQPRSEKPQPPSEEQGEVSEPISPPTFVQPPQPPVRQPQIPSPPPAEGKRSYRVRVGVFSQEGNVKSMLETLTAQGYHPYVEEEVVGNQKRYRIYVGAFENRESAERLKQELTEKGIPSVVEEKRE